MITFPGYTIKNDYSFGNNIFFIFKKRITILTGRILNPGFYYWELYSGLNGPFHSYNIALSEYKDIYK